MAHAAELIRFRLSDYPRFREALRITGQRGVMSSRVFRDLLQERFDIIADVRPLDPWGQFWLAHDQAVLFVLKWSGS